jgi:hypothetical protein
MVNRMRVLILVGVLALFGSGLPLGGQQAPAELVRLADRLAGQLDIAIQHAVLGRLAAGLEDLQVQAHQVLNLLVGRGGQGYDPRFGDPGDGVGLIRYAEQLGLAVADLGPRERLISENVLFFSNASSEDVRAAIQTRREGEARERLYRALGFLLAARGCPDDLPSEGGIRALQHLLSRSP